MAFLHFPFPLITVLSVLKIDKKSTNGLHGNAELATNSQYNLSKERLGATVRLELK